VRRAVRKAASAVAIGGTIVATACAPAPVERVRFADPVTGVGLPGPVGKADVAPCDDESRYVISLNRGATLEYEADLADAPELGLRVCLDGGDRHSRLELQVRAASGAAVEHRIPLAEGWTERRVPLVELAGRRVRVRLTARLPRRGRPLRIEEAYVRSTTSSPPPPRRRRVMLVSLDAFREDAIRGFGPSGATHDAPPTPRLDALVPQAQRFAPSWASAHWTRPSHAAMLTGLPAALLQMGAHDSVLPAGLETLAERLRSRGVATAGFASVTAFLDGRFGFARGFDVYRLASWTSRQEVRAVVSWLDEHRDRDAFVFVHFFEAHSDFNWLPYEAPGLRRAEVVERFGVRDIGQRDGAYASRRLKLLDEEPAVDRREVEALRYLYARGVESLDAALGELFDELRRAGLWDDLTLVVTADHGEAFGEHGRFLHTTAHEEILRVPLLVRWPGGAHAGERVAIPTTSLDLAPTILARFDITAPDLPGRDLAALPGNGRALQISQEAVRAGDWKLLVGATGGQAEEQLFDLAADPGEQLDRLAGAADEAVKLRTLWAGFHAAVRRAQGRDLAGGRSALTAEEEARLRALGYL